MLRELIEEIVLTNSNDLLFCWTNALSGFVTSISSSITEYLDWLGVRLWDKTTSQDIGEFSVVAFTTDTPDLENIVIGSLFEKSNEVEVRGSVGEYETYNCNSVSDNCFYTESIGGQSLLLTPPNTYHIWSLY